MRVIYTAAHGGDPDGKVPLGGGAAVCRQLVGEWERVHPFEWRLLEPSVLGEAAPSAAELVQFSEGSYARFCRSFERRVTDRILAENPSGTVVLSNDVS